MHKIRIEFNTIVEKYPKHSPLICYGRAIDGKRLSKEFIRTWFYKLVDRKDYLGAEREGIIDHLFKLNMDINNKKKWV